MMSGLSSTAYMNIRHELPTIGINQQHAKLQSAPFTAPELSVDYTAPQGDFSFTQATIDIDQSACWDARGFKTPTALMRDAAAKGEQSIKAVTEKYSSGAWNAARNAAKEGGAMFGRIARQNMMSEVIAWPTWVVQQVPAPEISVTPSQPTGQPDTSHTDINWNTTTEVNKDIRTGSAQTYIDNQGFLNMWMTVGYVDISA